LGLETILIKLQDGGDSSIFSGMDWRSVAGFLPQSGVIIITDHNVRDIYGGDFPPFPVISVLPGEKSKSLETIAGIVEEMLKAGIGRDGFVLGIGGGVVCDIAGFVASVYMRGVRFGFVSTTLLSQVDASTGGKNGVNSKDAKNIIGVFNNPGFVICDQAMLKTLSDDEYRSGLSELVKTALIKDSGLLSLIEEHTEEIINRDTQTLATLIARAISIKAGIVESDMREKGERRLLNFGHTLGHAAELEYSVPHGKAVAWGMLQAMLFSVEKGFFKMEELERVSALFRRLQVLPVQSIDHEIVAGRIIYDKKRTGKEINFIFLENPGNAFSARVSLEELAGFLMKSGT